MNIDRNILEIIEQGKTKENLYFLPDRQLDRKVYLEVSKALEYLGGKWNRKLKAHVFEDNVSDAIDNMLSTGEVTDKKKESQFFETPQNIVDQLIELAEIRSGHKCLEPSAGKGNVAKSLRKIAGDKMVSCVELNLENANMLIENGFLYTYRGDFLQCPVDCIYDRIVMNPPFAKQQDILHVQKALFHLKDGGILVSVMSLGVKFRQNKKTLDFLDQIKKYKFEIIDLPQEAFKTSGTMVNTIILKIIKVQTKEGSKKVPYGFDL